MDLFKEITDKMVFVVKNYKILSNDIIKEKIIEIDNLLKNDFILITFEKYYEIKHKFYPNKMTINPITGEINFNNDTLYRR